MATAASEEESDYDIWIRKRKAAMRKEQKKSMEGGWMRCAYCRKRGGLRCAACLMTTYCGLECHEKDWREGHIARWGIGLDIYIVSYGWTYENGYFPLSIYIKIVLKSCVQVLKGWFT